MRYWIYDGSYCGDLNLRWQPGTSELPDYCDGHVGYSVVPWKRRYGLASAALIELSRIVPTLGLKWLDIAMGIDNTASRQVALSAGGKFSQEYVASEQGGVLACRYRIACVDA
jgi:predicted acetyltransferase